MTHRYFSLAGLTGLSVLLFFTVPVSGQNAKVAPKTSAIKRLPDGHPDLQGTYDLATITPVDRIGTNLVLTKEEAAKLEAQYAHLRAQGDQAIQGDRASHFPCAVLHRAGFRAGRSCAAGGSCRSQPRRRHRFRFRDHRSPWPQA